MDGPPDDPIGIVQNDFISLWTALYNGLGVIQRDAAARKLSDKERDDSLQEVKDKLIHEIVSLSASIDKQLDGLGRKLEQSTAPKERIAESLNLLPLAIKGQEVRLAESTDKSHRLEALFRELMMRRREPCPGYMMLGERSPRTMMSVGLEEAPEGPVEVTEIIIHQLARLSLAKKVDGLNEYTRQLPLSAQEKLCSLLRAFQSSNAPHRRALPLLHGIICSGANFDLEGLMEEFISKTRSDVEMQVLTLALMYSAHPLPSLLQAIAKRLGELKSCSLQSFSARLRGIIGGSTIKDIPLPLTKGMVTLLCILETPLERGQFEEVCRWISENAGNLNNPQYSPSLAFAFRCLDKFMAERLDGALLKDCLFSMIRKLLLRSSANGLAVCRALPATANLCALLADLDDAFWSQAISENDESRAMASQCVTAVVPGSSKEGLLALHKKIEGSWTGKTPKVKRTLASFVILDSKCCTEAVALVKGLLAKELNDEIIYHLVHDLMQLDPQQSAVLFQDALRQSKPNVKTAFLAGCLTGDCVPEVEAPLMALLSKNDTSAIDQLLLVVALSDKSLSLKPEQWKACLGESIIVEAMQKFPFTPLCKLLRVLPQLDSEEVAGYVWKALILAAAKSSHQKSAILRALRSAPHQNYHSSGLTVICGSMLEGGDNVQLLADFIKAAVKNEADLLNFAVISHSPHFRSLQVWRELVGRTLPKSPEVATGETALSKILSAPDSLYRGELYKSVIKTFPQSIPAIAKHLKQLLTRLVEAGPLLNSEECLKIFSTPDDQLPIVDGKPLQPWVHRINQLSLLVLTPLRKAAELAAKKDPSKRLAIPTSTQGTLSKAEKGAVEAEMIRERQIKARMEDFIEQITRMGGIVSQIAQVDASSMEKHLSSFADYLFAALEFKWLGSSLVVLLYQLLRCCHRPLGMYGPLLASAYLTIRGEHELVDRNWCFARLDENMSALARHLSCEQVMGLETFTFTLPIINTILAKSLEIELDEEVAQTILQMLTLNLTLGLDDITKIQDTLKSLESVYCAVPAVSSLVVAALDALIVHSKMTEGQAASCKYSLDSPSEVERRFALLSAERVTRRFPSVPSGNATFETWILLLCHETGANEAIAKRLYQELYGRQEYHKEQSWEAVFAIASNQDYDGAISQAAIAALVAGLPEPMMLLDAWTNAYTRMVKGRLPEIAQVRAAKVDLTVVGRERLANILLSIGKAMQVEQLDASNFALFIQHLISFCLSEAFFDPAESVHGDFLNATGLMLGSALKVKCVVDSVASICDEFLSSKKPRKLSTDEECDRVRVYAVILLAKVAEKFEADDPRRAKLLSSLIATLSTPSEGVQQAAADAMASLLPAIPNAAVAEYYDRFLKDLVAGTSMAIRRGAAYGLGALVRSKGSKVIIKERGLIDFLEQVLQDKSKGAEAKQGALFGLELLAKNMGSCFEPYIAKLLDALIGTFANGRNEVRNATLDAAQMMMSTVSSLGARILLPALLGLLNCTNWRSKVGAIEWLGAMASLSPRVLARQLPVILPKLVDALTESHHGVQRAAREALTRYGNVVRSPEVRALSGLILEALANPPQATEKCLHGILHTAFAHVIDGPSLALMIPVLQRALRDRSAGGTEVKKRAAQIIGNLATDLVDPRDLAENLSFLAPALVLCLSDPVPEVRSHCGKVLGILVKTVGEGSPALKNVAPELIAIIGGIEATSVDRAGAAQALAEIFAARGAAKISNVLEEVVLVGLGSKFSPVREGFVMLLGYLPAAFDAQQNLPELYEVGLRVLLVAALKLLADDNEAVREAATEACHSLVSRCARIDHIAVFDVLLSSLSISGWRCRLGVLRLIQEFLSKFADSQDDASNGEEASLAMPSAEELTKGGIDAGRLATLMSKAFLFRFDTSSAAIRNHALTIWKTLASHPIRTIAQIIETLVEECVRLSMTEDGMEIVHKALEDMLGKIGDRLIGPLLDICNGFMEEEDEVIVLGSLFVAQVAAQFLGSGNFPGLCQSMLEGCIPKFIGLLESGLVLSSAPARNRVGTLFVALVRSTERINYDGLVERVLDPILEELVSDPVLDPIALSSLTLLLQADQSEQVLDITMDALLGFWKSPHVESSSKDEGEAVELAATMCEVQATVFEAAGGEASSYVVPILCAFVAHPLYPRLALSQGEGSGVGEQVFVSALTGLEADEDSPYQVSLSQLLETLYSDHRVASFDLIRGYCKVPEADLSRFYDIWPMRLLSEEATELVGLARGTLCSLVESCTGAPSKMYRLGQSLSDALRKDIKLDPSWREFVLLIVKNILVPLLTQNTLVAAENRERRELACQLIGRLTRSVATLAWSSAMTSLVGALIRTASDKSSTGENVFSALTSCVVTQTALVKPFYPQLQRIFLNALIVESCREAAVPALCALLPALPRPEAAHQELSLIIQDEEGQVELDTKLGVLKILVTCGTVMEEERLLALAQRCMASEEALIRDYGAQWIKAVLEKPEVASSRFKLQSLLSLQ